jgi:hypothetical protein
VILLDFRCDDGHDFERLVYRSEIETTMCDCGSATRRLISAVVGRVRRGEVTRGANDPTPPGFASTEALADGMSVSEWRAQNRKRRRRQRMDRIKAAIG